MKEDNMNNRIYYDMVDEMIQKISREVGVEGYEMDQKVRDIVIYICMMTIRE